MSSIPKTSYILDFKRGYVTGYGLIDNVYLLGEKSSADEYFSDNISLLIQNPFTNISIKIPLPNASGYDAKLYLGYFTSFQKMDILISMDTGGSGRYILAYLYAINNLNPVLLLDSTTFESNSMYDAIFQDNFKVMVKSNQDDTTFIIDVSSNKDSYINANIYNKNGKLLTSTEGGVLGLGALWPLQENYDELTSLVALQRIIGINNSDNLGAIETYLKWDGSRLITSRKQLTILPSYTT